MSVSAWFTAWTISWPGLLVATLLLLPYAGWLAAARKRGVRWPAARVAAYLLGVLIVLYATCGPLGARRTDLMWVFAARAGVLAAFAPLALALGDPVRLLASARGRELSPPGWARWLMFPLVGSVASAVSLLLVFVTGYGQAAIDHPLVDLALVAHLLAGGLLAVLPLLVGELLPSWATAPVRVFIAFLDGLIDAVPGIVVMTASGLLMPHFPGSVGRIDPSASLDQRFAGGALLVTAESIGIPVLAAVFMEWLRSDREETAAIDAQLDARDAAATDRRTGGDASESTAEGDEPWWLSDPRFADRYRRRD